MAVRDGIRAASAMAAAFALAGCVREEEDPKTADRDTGRAADAKLSRPIHPRCGIEQYARPEIRRARTEDGKGTRWALDYSPKARGRAAFTSLLLVEYPPVDRRFKPSPEQSRETIDGRLIALTFPNRRTPTHTAQWQTDRAIYSIIAQEPRLPPRKRTAAHPTLARIISCLP